MSYELNSREGLYSNHYYTSDEAHEACGGGVGDANTTMAGGGGAIGTSGRDNISANADNTAGIGNREEEPQSPPHHHDSRGASAAGGSNTFASCAGANDDDENGDEEEDSDDEPISNIRVVGGPKNNIDHFFRATPMRRRTFLLLATIAICTLFSIISLTLKCFKYVEPNNTDIVIAIGYWKTRMCPAESDAMGTVCKDLTNSAVLCDNATDPLASAGNVGIAVLVFEVLIILLLLCEMGGYVLHHTMTFRLSWLVWLLLMVQWSVTTSVYFQDKCHNTSFWSMDFKYQGAWVLPFIAWLTLPCVLLCMVRWRRRLNVPVGNVTIIPEY